MLFKLFQYRIPADPDLVDLNEYLDTHPIAQGQSPMSIGSRRTPRGIPPRQSGVVYRRGGFPHANRESSIAMGDSPTTIGSRLSPWGISGKRGNVRGAKGGRKGELSKPLAKPQNVGILFCVDDGTGYSQPLYPEQLTN